MRKKKLRVKFYQLIFGGFVTKQGRIPVTRKVNKKQFIISKEVYIHLKDNKDKLAATICLLNSNLGLGRGISVCSICDNFDRKKGRHYAKRFAIRALKGRPCSFEREEAINLLCKIPFFLSETATLLDVEKAEISPVLSDLELKVYKGGS